MKKNTIIIIVVVAVAALVYFYFMGGKIGGDSSLETEVNPEVEIASSRILSLLNQISSLQIDTSLLNTPAYKTLRDYSVQVPPQNVGRLNPFAPISGVVNQ